MTNNNPHEPAFPSGLIDPSTPDDAVHPVHVGMTLRDYFAAKAMGVVLKRWTDEAIQDGVWSLLTDPDRNDGPSDLSLSVAQECYVMADAMLNERELEPGGKAIAKATGGAPLNAADRILSTIRKRG